LGGVGQGRLDKEHIGEHDDSHQNDDKEDEGKGELDHCLALLAALCSGNEVLPRRFLLHVNSL